MAVFGDTLRQARAQKGVSLKEAEQATRINRHHLQALEDENFDALPPPIYQRGIVRNYATYLDLDAAKLLEMFEEASGSGTQTEVVPAVKPLNMPRSWAPNFAIIAFMVVMSAVVFAWAYSAYFAPSDAVPTATEQVVTVTPVPTDQLLLPTSTPVPPSPTATATPKVAPTKAPTSTPVPPTATPTQPPAASNGNSDNSAAAVDQGQQSANSGNAADSSTATGQGPAATEAPPPTTAASTNGSMQLVITAGSNDITLTVVADGTTVMDGTLAAGESTQAFTGKQFDITTSDPNSTTYTVNGGNPFQMSGNSNSLP